MERSTALNKNLKPPLCNPLGKRVWEGGASKTFFCGIVALFFLGLLPPDSLARSGPDRERILETIARIENAYRDLQSYACDIEGIYFESGRELERYVYRFYFRQPNLFRIEFREPYPGMTIFYTQGDMEFVARPFSMFPSIQFRFSVDNSLFKTPSGQGVNQMHLFYFLEFLRQNAGSVPQNNPDFTSNEEGLSFWVISEDYARGGARVRYRMHIDTRVWLPDRIERYDMAGIPLEFTIFRNFIVDPALDRAFFDSGYREPASSPLQEPVRP